MDLVGLVTALVEIIAGIIVIAYLLIRKQKRRTAVGIGGSLVLLGLDILGVIYRLIPDLAVWVFAGLGVVILVFSSYVAVRSTQPNI